MKKIFLIILFFFILLHAYSTGKSEEPEKHVVKVFVSILPQVYFAERLGGKRVSVQELVPPGKEPHVYEPTPRQMASLARADVYFHLGLPFEKVILPKIKEAFPDVKIIDTSQDIRQRYFTHNEEKNMHDEKGTSEVPDPHTWLGTPEVKIQLGHMVNALINIDPEGKPWYESRYKEFIAEIDALHERITKALEPLKGKRFYVFHPAFGYFADEFGLEQVPIEIEGKEPGPRQLARIIEMAQKEGVRVIFVQPQFSRNNAKTIAGHIGGVVIPIDPLKKDWRENMEEIARNIEEGLGS
ncbi:MAG: zinc ABC transporter substrate-binding protein [Spirochaetales bacterium]|nr:zinc ABC transporter substrate-binding protein [Spirochaetales bacterium]